MAAILVTGGAGYIGSHTLKALRRAGRSAVAFDNLCAGHAEAVGGAPLVEGDVRDGDLLRQTMRRYGVTAVMHFAGLLSVGDSMRDPSGYYANNVGGTLTLLEAMAAEGVSRLVFSSTCAVYGEPVATPIDETHPKAPVNPYGESKLTVERALPHYARAYGLRATSLRYFNAAGADPDGELGEVHDPEIHLVPRAIAAALGGPALDVFGGDYPTPDGTCLRDYVHVSDLAEAHVLALDRMPDAGAEPAAYNLGNGRPYSVLEVVAAVERALQRPVPRRQAARRPGDPAVLYAASARARAELGWRPRFPELGPIVETACRWHAAHPNGYAGARAGG